MLKFLRRKAQSPTLQITILIIIVVFVFWGVGRQNGDSRSAVATVNGHTIEYQEYQKEYNQTMSRLRERLGGKIPKGLLESLDIKHQVIDRLIQRTLMRQGARAAGLRVSDAELQQAIDKMPVFQKNGAFNLTLYNNVLTASRLNVSKFEAGMRYDLLANKVKRQISHFAEVSPAELKILYNYNYTSLKFSYAAFKALDFSDRVQVSPKKLQDFYNKHKANYFSAPQRRIKYLLFSAAAQKAKTPSADNIQTYYQNNIQRFTIPERRDASHILIMSKSSDSPQQIAAKRKKINEILALARAGKDFAALARKYSQDNLASRGGDLGFFSRGQMVKPFENAVFSLKVGQISGVVKTQFGFHIIKLNKIEPARTKPLKEVRKQIIATIMLEMNQNLAFKAANKAYEQIILAGSLDKYKAKTPAAAIKETGFFARRNPPPPLKALPAVIKKSFALNKGELSSIINTDKGYAIVYVEDAKAPAQKDFKTVKAQVKQDFIAQESVKSAKEAADKMLAALHKKGKLAELAAKAGVEVMTTPYITRAASSAAQLPAPVIKEGLRLSALDPLPKDVTAVGNTFYVLEFKESKAPNPSLLAKNKAGLENQIRNEKSNELLTAWIEYLQKKAEIKINEKLL
ncbi:Peptidyl-prolyl cis-trans isomerase PpiC [hydrothermal vent metagenome]|uniref:Periplasmic chaperone PpiD n=1 Tax=hydrothermal vent metagenome TaxID=652676 RepID=A0A3B0WA60_9ZZZZ